MSGASPSPMPTRWSVRARNLPEHARNAIHTDEGGRAAGFPGALVAGVTTYALLTHPLVEAWGEAWIGGGGGEVRFVSPVFAGDLVAVTPAPVPDVAGREADAVVAAIVDDARGAPGAPRAVLHAWHGDRGWVDPPAAIEAPLRRVAVTLDGEWGPAYAVRAGDDLDLTVRLGLVHPAVWPALANHVVHEQLARGSWIHVRSRIQHHRAGRAGEVATVDAAVVDRFRRRGERIVADVRITGSDGDLIARLEHEAIIDLREPD